MFVTYRYLLARLAVFSHFHPFGQRVHDSTMAREGGRLRVVRVPTTSVADRPPTAAVGDVPGGFIAELESLRGVAISLVFALHADSVINSLPSARPSMISPWRAWMLGGHTGVSLFFILSGFLLSRPFLVEAAGGARLERSRYYARRVLRIMPLYSVAIIVAAILCARGPADVWRGLPYLVFLNSIPGMTTPLWPFSQVWWSLATEAQFYLLLPLLPLFVRSRRGRLAGTAGLIVYATAYTAFATGAVRMATIPAQHQLAHSLLGRAPLFAFGILAAVVYERYGARLRVAASRAAWLRRGGADVAMLGVFLCLAFLMRSVGYLKYVELETTRPAWHLVEGALWTAVVLLLLLAPLRSRALFLNRVLATVGRVSYSIYLVHLPVLIYGADALRSIWPGALRGWSLASAACCIPLAAACLGISMVTYAWIERPFLAGRRRWRYTPESRIPAATAAAATRPVIEHVAT